MNPAGKKALVTGGARRIGRAVAEALAAQGAEITIQYRDSSQEAAQLAETMRWHTLQADFSRPEELDKFDGLSFDIVVNCASLYRPAASLAEESEESLREHFEVNFFSPLRLLKRIFAANPGGGVAINFLDQEIMLPCPAGGAYSLSKRALAAATLELARENAPRWRVCGIAPGPVLPPPHLPESRMEKVLRRVPTGEKIGLDEICRVVLALIENPGLNGAIITLDGGEHLHPVGM